MTNLWIEMQNGHIANLSKLSHTYSREDHKHNHRLCLAFPGDGFEVAFKGSKEQCEAARDAIKKLIEQKTAAFVPSITKMVAEMEK